MNAYSVSTRAAHDLREIYEYIARDNRTAAGRLLRRFHDTFGMLAKGRQMGERRDDLLPGMRCITEGKYVIFFREIHGGVEIVRVIHGARDLDELF